MKLLAIEFPPISHVIEWPGILLEDTPFEVNKVVILMWLSAALVLGFFYLAGRKQALVPTGIQNIAEATVDFVRNGIIMQTMGPHGLSWTPFMLTLFMFIMVGNVWGIVPVAQMPTNARIAFPALMAIVVYVLYHFMGIKEQGLGHYLKNTLILPGVPPAMHVLLVPIEFRRHHRGGVHRQREPGHLAVRVRPARVPHGLRDPRRLPAGVHLHDARRRLHRQGHLGRALIRHQSPPLTEHQGEASAAPRIRSRRAGPGRAR
jgi:hypothetical protein